MALPADLVDGLTGEWHGTYGLWLEPGTPMRECETDARIEPVLDGRLLQLRYSWSFDGERQEGVALLGRNGEGVYQMAWTDSWHNGDTIMFCTGDGPEPTVTGTYAESEGPWRWRTEFAVVDEDHIVVSATNISPDGAEAKATAAAYTRVR
jgi:Protein of unknown function (DUF1579)